MKVFIFLLISVFLCACSTRSNLMVPSGNGTVADGAVMTPTADADNSTCTGDDCPDGKGTQDTPDSVPVKMVKGVLAGVVIIGLAVLYVLTRIPAGAR